MTEQQISNLRRLVEESDFIELLKASRPPLSEQNWQSAAGWENCVEFVQSLATPGPVDRPGRSLKFVDVDKLT